MNQTLSVNACKSPLFENRNIDIQNRAYVTYVMSKISKIVQYFETFLNFIHSTDSHCLDFIIHLGILLREFLSAVF